MAEPTVLLSGLGIPESPRWHDGRLWFCNWIDRQVVAAGLDGTAEVILARDPDSQSMGYSIDWLPDSPYRADPGPSRRGPGRRSAVSPRAGRPSAPAKAGRRPRHRPAVGPGTGRP